MPINTLYCAVLPVLMLICAHIKKWLRVLATSNYQDITRWIYLVVLKVISEFSDIDTEIGESESITAKIIM